MGAQWDKVKGQAEKILGDGAEVPDMPPAVGKAVDQWDKAFQVFKGSKDALQDNVLDMDNANSGVQNAYEQLRAKIEKNDFKLDPKKDAKKIAEVRKLLLGYIDAEIAKAGRNDKMLGELGKHLTQMGAYKSS